MDLQHTKEYKMKIGKMGHCRFIFRAILGFMAFVMPFMTKQATASEENIKLLSSLSTYGTDHSLSDTIAAWYGTDKTNGQPALFVYDLVNNQETKLANGPFAYNPFPHVSGNNIVYAKQANNQTSLFVCTYNAAQKTCPEVSIANNIGDLTSVAMDGYKIAWVAGNNAVEMPKLMYCEFNGVACPTTTLMNEMTFTSISMHGNYIVFVKAPLPESDPFSTDVYLFHLAKNKVIHVSDSCE
jgi:hypothetical protein